MARYHGTTQKLNLALELAKKVLACKETGADHHEIEDMAQMAEYLIIEVEHKEKEG